MSFIVITGANTGLGKATAQLLATRHSANVVLACRNEQRAQSAIEDIKAAAKARNISLRDEQLQFAKLDLGNLVSVKEFASWLAAREDKMQALILNAGVTCVHYHETSQGYEEMFGVNHLGHFALVHGVLDKIKRDQTRVVVLSSGAATFVKGDSINFEELPYQKTLGYANFMKQYGLTKLSNQLMTNKLATILEGTGAVANAVDPGAVDTELGRDGSKLLKAVITPIIKLFFQTPIQAADSSVFLATDPKATELNGKLILHCKPVDPPVLATRKDLADQLWTLSEELISKV